MLYLLSNAYQPLEDVTLQLEVELDDQPFEEKVLSVFPSLNVGTMPGSYHYKPEQGWENGNYSFSLQLISDDEVLARSTGAEFDLEGVAGAPLLSSLLAWLEEHWKIIAVIAALLALAGAGWVLLNRLRNSVKVTLENSELVATFNESTGEIIKTTVNYSLLNERRTTPQVRVELQVSKDEDSDSITIASMDSLEKGRSSGSYEYFPQEGWQDGVRYRFRLALYLAGKLDTLTKLRMTKAAEPG